MRGKWSTQKKLEYVEETGVPGLEETHVSKWASTLSSHMQQTNVDPEDQTGSQC